MSISISSAFYKYDFGLLKIVYTDSAVIEISYKTEIDCENVHSELSDKAALQIKEYLNGKRKIFDFPIEMHGTDFQKKVWNALLKIPYGETRTYKQIAEAICNSKACRAVGMANNKNPLMIVVPCHRVIGSNGKLVGYAFGLDIKEMLLEIERKNK